MNKQYTCILPQNTVLGKLAASETFYSMEACQSAARAAENAHFLFQGDKPNDSEVRAICSPKRLGKQEK